MLRVCLAPCIVDLGKKKKYSVQLHLENERKKECMYESVSMKKKKKYAGCQDDKILT